MSFQAGKVTHTKEVLAVTRKPVNRTVTAINIISLHQAGLRAGRLHLLSASVAPTAVLHCGIVIICELGISREGAVLW